jgi:sulfate adenylyltransferase
VARALELALQQEGGRKVTLLDGETIRQELSAELGYTRADRDLNISRMSFVAAELTKAGAAVICASIAPFNEARLKSEEAISKHGGFYLIHMATPLEHAMKRDRQGVYRRALNKEIQGFTGVDDAYEVPTKCAAAFDLSKQNVSQIIHEIILLLERDGYIGGA